MANTQALCSQFKVEVLNGHHAIGTCTETRTAATKDTYKAALYLASATVNAATTAYSATNEVSGSGYTAGGVAVTNATAPTLSGTASIWTPSASIVYSSVTLATSFDAVLIYNDTFTTKRAVSVHTFTAQTITAGTFTLTMPAGGLGTSLLQLT